jgi:hypothetical protein
MDEATIIHEEIIADLNLQFLENPNDPTTFLHVAGIDQAAPIHARNFTTLGLSQATPVVPFAKVIGIIKDNSAAFEKPIVTYK